MAPLHFGPLVQIRRACAGDTNSLNFLTDMMARLKPQTLNPFRKLYNWFWTFMISKAAMEGNGPRDGQRAARNDTPRAPVKRATVKHVVAPRGNRLEG